jgi:hypothetical protein
MSVMTESSLTLALSKVFCSLLIWLLCCRPKLLARAQQLAQFLDLLLRNKATADQAMSQQVGDPSRIADIGLTTRDIFDVSGIRQNQLEIAVTQNVPNRLPVNAGCFHGHMGATHLGQPCQQEQQPGGRGLEGPNFTGDFAVQCQAHARHHGLLVNVETATTPVNDFHQLPPPKARRQRGDLIEEFSETCSGGIGAPWHNQGCSRSPGPTTKRASRTKEKTDLCADNAQTL